MQIIFETNIVNYNRIPGMPIAYWASEKILSLFEGQTIESIAFSCKGLDTCDNDKFVRFWFEVCNKKIGFNINDNSQSFNNKWFPYCKGGDYRKWYGNYENIVLWENNGIILRNVRDDKGRIKSRPQNTKYYFKEGLTYNSISSSYRAVRYMDNAIFGGGGSGLFVDGDDTLLCVLALINSKVSASLFKYINSGLNFLVGDMLRIPYSKMIEKVENLCDLSQDNIDMSKTDWDSFENSWDFKKHPLI